MLSTIRKGISLYPETLPDVWTVSVDNHLCPAGNAYSAGQKEILFSAFCTRLHQKPWMVNLTDRVSGNDFQSLHQHLVLVFRNFHCLICRTRPAESPTVQPLVHEQEAITFPEQGLDPVTAPPAEKKQGILIMWIQLKLIPDNRSQPVNSTPKIRIATLSEC